MAECDLQGRPYANINTLQDGQPVWLDDGFTCHRPGPVRIVMPANGEPYFICHDGIHLLDGQLDDDEPYLMGIYATDPGEVGWEHDENGLQE